MSFLIQYRRLFTVQWLHEYYLSREPSLFQDIQSAQLSKIIQSQQNNYKVSKDFQITPTSECSNILKSRNLVFKKDNFGFFVACKVSQINTSSYKPFVPMDDSFSLRFSVKLNSTHIYNISNTRLEKDITKKDHYVYYFSNRANNLTGLNSPYLTHPISDFNSDYDYEAGEIFLQTKANGDKLLFEAIEDNGPGAYNNSNWSQILKNTDPLPQFVTNLDRIVLRPKIFSHKVESANKEKLTILIKNHNGVLVKTLDFQSSKAGVKLSQCELELINLPSAYYSMKVQDENGVEINNLNLTFFMDDELFAQRPFALIECFHEPGNALGAYRWLDQNNDNKLLTPAYTIHWKNRSTYWRYYYDVAPNFTSTQVKAYDHNTGNPINKVLVSKHPLGLTQFGRKIEMDIDNETTFLPNPNTLSIYPEKGKIYSEINMGGGFGPPV